MLLFLRIVTELGDYNRISWSSQNITEVIVTQLRLNIPLGLLTCGTTPILSAGQRSCNNARNLHEILAKFLSNFSAYTIFCKFCQHNLDCKHVNAHKDHLQPIVCLKNDGNTVRGLKKMELQWMKMGEKNVYEVLIWTNLLSTSMAEECEVSGGWPTVSSEVKHVCSGVCERVCACLCKKQSWPRWAGRRVCLRKRRMRGGNILAGQTHRLCLTRSLNTNVQTVTW